MKKIHLSYLPFNPICLGIFFVLTIFFIYASPTLAQSVNLQIPIPDLNRTVETCSGAMCSGIGLYIAAFAKWLIVAISILAVLFMMIGGIIWLTSRSSQKQVTFARKLIWDSLMGLLLALGSTLLLGVINPNLVTFEGIGVGNIGKIDFTVVNIAEDDGYAPVQGPVGSVGANGTTGGSAVAQNGTISMTLAESKTLPGVKLASSVVASFDAAIEEIRRTHPEYKLLSGGGQGPRSDPRSCHNNGLSVDINPDQNPCGSDCLAYPGENCCWGRKGVKVGSGEFKPYTDARSQTKEIVQIFQKNGWCWGGNWKSFRDLHHFSRCSKDCADVRVYQFPTH